MTTLDDVQLSPAPPLPSHPAVEKHLTERAKSTQLRVADWITKFAGSMLFVYIHLIAFFLWMVFVEKSPWATLTLVVSLEAIILSTFVMIGQNRAAAIQQAKADHDFTEQQLLLKNIGTGIERDSAMETQVMDMEVKLATLMSENTSLTQAVKADTTLLEEIHRHVTASAPNAGSFPPDATPSTDITSGAAG